MTSLDDLINTTDAVSWCSFSFIIYINLCGLCYY